MTLTELRYIVTLAQEHHFGRAAARCFVSQPTLSTAVLKVEEELGIALFERRKNEVLVTPMGEKIVQQALRVLEEAALIKSIAKQNKDELTGVLRLGAIATVCPYLVPDLIPVLGKHAPMMPLEIEENLTAALSNFLKSGKLDAIVIALPFVEPGILIQPLYDEPFSVVVPVGHHWENKAKVKAEELAGENVLMLHAGHCFRNQVVGACPELSRSDTGGMQGGSLETIRNMVASGLGISVLPSTALTERYYNKLIRVIPFDKPVPSRRIGIAWRKSFPRPAVIDLLRRAVESINLQDVRMVVT